MNSYLELAKQVLAELPAEISEQELAERRQRKLEEAGRRGVVVRWSEYPTWIVLHDPTTSEWHDWPAADCYPSMLEEADRWRKKKGNVRKNEEYEERRSGMQGERREPIPRENSEKPSDCRKAAVPDIGSRPD